MKRVFIVCLSSFLMSNANAMFCPTNFSHIDIGDSIKSVEEKCGTPVKKETKPIAPPTPQEWTYYIPQTVSSGAGPQSGTLKTTVSFDASGKAINISVNGIGVGASTICGNTINLGDSVDNVKANCGKPSFVNQQAPDSAGAAKPDEQTTYTYDSTPPMTLIFKNGVLTDSQ